MKKLLFYLVFLTLMTLLGSCDKSRTKTIRFTGIFLDWFNRKPVAGTISVLGQTSSIKMEGYSVGTIQARSDGSFDRTFPAARSNEYYIYVTSPDGETDTQNLVREGNIYNYGEIYISHTFICKVHLIRLPGSDGYVQFDSGHIVAFDHAPDTFYCEKKSIAFSRSGAHYPLSYSTFSLFDFNKQIKSLQIPITNSDTVRAELFY